MKGLAIISDVHGNAVALEAVAADAARNEIAEIVCLGDLAVGGPQPREVLQRLRELGCRAVRGNADGWLLATTRESELHAAFDSAPHAQVLVGGHTHVQLLRTFGDRLLLNPGSVGLPLGSVAATLAGGTPLPTRAEYAQLRAADSRMEGFVFRVPIDVGAVAAATEAMPHASWAGDLERRIARWNLRTADA
jgi:predicted phosphodiesterase